MIFTRLHTQPNKYIHVYLLHSLISWWNLRIKKTMLFDDTHFWWCIPLSPPMITTYFKNKGGTWFSSHEFWTADCFGMYVEKDTPLVLFFCPRFDYSLQNLFLFSQVSKTKWNKWLCLWNTNRVLTTTSKHALRMIAVFSPFIWIWGFVTGGKFLKCGNAWWMKLLYCDFPSFWKYIWRNNTKNIIIIQKVGKLQRLKMGKLNSMMLQHSGCFYNIGSAPEINLTIAWWKVKKRF